MSYLYEGAGATAELTFTDKRGRPRDVLEPVTVIARPPNGGAEVPLGDAIRVSKGVYHIEFPAGAADPERPWQFVGESANTPPAVARGERIVLPRFE